MTKEETRVVPHFAIPDRWKDIAKHDDPLIRQILGEKMLTSEKSIEVAEKVWGMELIYNEYDHTAPSLVNYYQFKEGGLNMSWHKNKLKREVLSWAGFGRTVEAMALKETGGTQSQRDFAHNMGVRIGNQLSEYINCQIPVDSLWEQTHLAALEAMKK